jgi:mono/diheme cytochrome c family protein
MKKVLTFLLLAAVVGLVLYQALIYYDNDFKYGRMRETPGVRPHEQPLLIMQAGVVPVSGGDAVLKSIPAEELKSPLSMTDAQVIAAGKADYLTFCAQCHGPNHDGSGTVGQSFQPLPTDLRSAQVQSKAEGLIFQTVSYGIPETRQPPLATTIRIEDRWRIVAYIKSLGLRE